MMIESRILQTSIIAVVVAAVLPASALAKCPITLPYEELEACIVCEGSGMTYEQCKAETKEALEYAADEPKTSYADTSKIPSLTAASD